MIVFCAGALRAGTSFTIQDVLSAPFPSELTAAPGGDAFAWVMDAQGVRNIWIARAPEFTPVRITRFSADDGQALGELAWVRDGSAVLFTRGGSANGRGEIPNPLHTAEGANQEVWIAAASGAERSRRLATGHGAAVAPDGRNAVFVQGGQLWSVALEGDAAAVQLTHARGTASGVVWSPDGRHVAFTSSRTDHSFIGVYNFAAHVMEYVDAGADFDQAPVWSPDGSAVAFVRVPGGRYALAWGPKRTGQPWSIRIAQLKSGEGREVWRAREGMGSVFWPTASAAQLLWSGAGTIVFPWEGDGWLHLYAVGLEGGKAALLTPGAFEVENAALTVDGKSVLYSSNQGDLERRHLWSVAVAGGAAIAITKGMGVEARPVALAGNRAGFVRSSATEPARVAVVEGGGGAPRDITAGQIPAGYPSNALVTPETVEFTAADGVRLHAQLFRPAKAGAGRHPAVVFFHGGSRRQMMPAWHYMSYYSQAYGFNQYLASLGYVVLSVNYRSGTGYGERFREALHYGATGGSEFADVLAAGNYLRARADVDAAHIGLWGGSYGGYLTAMGLAKASNIFAAGVDLHGVHDWTLEITNYVPDYEPVKQRAVATTAFQSSPMAYMETWKSPVLLIHGDDDRNVTFSQTVLLEEKLRARGVHFEELIFPDEVHEFLLHSHWLEAYKAADGFFQKYLQPGK